MKILIAGASGFIGHALVNSLHKEHQISVLGRNKSVLQREFSEDATCYAWDDLSTLDANQFDAVINLCGSNIAASRWNDAIKKELIDSRVKTCDMLINWIIKNQAKPHFICANAVGIYGVQTNGDQIAFDENSPINTDNPPDFLSEIGVQWQAALQPAIDYGLQVTTTRFGVVLEKNQGMLKKLFLSFYLGMGAIVGDGKQCLSWVHIQDVVGAITFLLGKPALTGAFNVTAPYPVSQQEFARTLAACLHRPLLLKMPPFLIRLLFGEMGELLLLKGQRVLPKRLLEEGYEFQYPTIKQALQHEFER